MTRDEAGKMADAILRKLERIPVKLLVKKVCRDCGAVLRTDVEWEEHYRYCPGPIRLVFTEDGIAEGEPFDE
jgi:hypothetical protein